MSQSFLNQKETPTSESPSASTVSGDGSSNKGFWTQHVDCCNRNTHDPVYNKNHIEQGSFERSSSPSRCLRHGPSSSSPAVAISTQENTTMKISTLHHSGDSSARLSSGIQSLTISSERSYGPSISAENDREDFAPEQSSAQYSDTSKFLGGTLETSYDVTAGFSLENMPEEDRLKWGQGEGIDVDDLLSHFDPMVSKDDTEETVSDTKNSDNGIDKLPIHKRCTSQNVFGDQIGDVGGMDAIDGLPPWTKTSSGVTGGLSVKDTTYSNEEHLSTSSVPFSGLRPTPSRGGGVNLLRPASLSAVGHAVTMGDYAPSDAQPAIQVGSVAVAEKDPNNSMDKAEKWDTEADFSLNDGAREITDEDRITLGLYDGWPYKLSDANTGLPPMTEESWHELETRQTNRRFASDGPSEIDTGRVTAENPSAGTRPLPSIPANVSSLRNLELDEPFKLFDPPEPKTMQQEEAASDVVDASGYISAQLSAIPFHAANSKTVVDTAAHLTGEPEMYDTASPMKGTTKDMPADFGLQKWTGDDSVDQDTKYAKLVSSDSERPESSLESRDFMLWAACYPDDPDKARELEASTGVPGIRVYPVDVFFRATSNPQVSNEVDASQKSGNSRTEMETQVSPRRLSNE